MSSEAEQLQSIIRELREYQINGISLDPLNMRIRFDFIPQFNEPRYSLHLLDVAQFAFSKSFGDEDTEVLNVYDIILKDVTAESLNILRDMRYAWQDGNGNPNVNTDKPMYHLHIEGDVCFDVICTSYQIMGSTEARKVR